MSLLKNKKKEEAISRMRKLKLMENPIREFEEEGKLNMSEGVPPIAGILYWVEEENVKQAIAEFEEEYNALVYHVIHTMTEFGNLYAFLYVSEHEEEWEMDNDDLENYKQGVVYVYNATNPEFSELGTIGIEPMNGGLYRTW